MLYICSSLLTLDIQLTTLMRNYMPKSMMTKHLFASGLVTACCLLFLGCKEGSQKEVSGKTRFDKVIAQKEFNSKIPLKRWELVKDVLTANYENKHAIDDWLLEVAPVLFLKKADIPTDILQSINYELYNTHIKKSAFQFAKLTLKTYTVQEDAALMAYPAATLSNYYQDIKMYDSVGVYNRLLKQSLPLADSLHLKVIYYTNNANLLKENGELFASAVNYHKALGLINPNDSLSKFTLLTNLSAIYHDLNYPDKSMAFIDSASRLIPIKDWSAEALNHAGVVYSKSKEYQKSEKMFRDAITKSLAEENNISLAQSYANYANLNRKLKRYLLASRMMSKSDSICVSLGLDYGILINRINRAELFFDLKAYDHALNQLNLVKAELALYKSVNLQINYYELLYRIYDSLGYTDLANSAYRTYHTTKEAHFGDIPRSILAEWELATENEKQTKARSVYELYNEQQSKEKYIVILVAAILLLIFSLFFFLRNRKHILDRQALNQERQRIAFELELKSKQLISESLKNLTVQNTKDEMLQALELIIQELPKAHHAKFHDFKKKLVLKKSDALLNEFETRFNGVYEQFYQKLKQLSDELTPHELRICAFMRLNISTKEIALLTNRTTGTIDNTRSSIRKKLKLDDEINLQDYLLSI